MTLPIISGFPADALPGHGVTSRDGARHVRHRPRPVPQGICCGRPAKVALCPLHPTGEIREDQRDGAARDTEEPLGTDLRRAALGQRILERALLPGMKLPEDSLGERFGTSRTLIRQALERLAAECIPCSTKRLCIKINLYVTKEWRNRHKHSIFTFKLW